MVLNRLQLAGDYGR